MLYIHRRLTFFKDFCMISTMQAKKYFGPLNFYKYALSLSIPIIVQMFIQNFVSLIDNFMVANLGNIKMSAVNTANQITFLFFVSISTLAIGGGIFMAQCNGARDKKGMKQSYQFKVLSMALVAVFLISFSYVLPGYVLEMLLRGNDDVDAIVKEGVPYLKLIALSFIPITFSVAISSSLRDVGKVKIPMYVVIVSTLLNTFFNYCLIYGNFYFPRLEVRGAAYATIIARVFELVVYLIYVKKLKIDFYTTIFHIFDIDWKIFVKIFNCAIFVFIADMSWAISETIAVAVYNGRGGSAVVAGMAAGWTIANLFFLIFPTVSTCISVVVGTTLGKSELERAKTEARWLRIGALILGTFVAFLELTSIYFIPIIYGGLSIEAHAIVKKLLIIVALYMPLWTYQNAQYATARAGGDTIMSVWIDCTVNLALFTPGMIILGYFTSFDAPSMYGIVKVTSIVKAVLAGLVLKKERWVRNIVSSSI